ncbi:MAG: hypothetical protein RL885_15385 [Planctomycetota bacterium]
MRYCWILLLTGLFACSSPEPMPETLAFEGQYSEQLGRAELLKREHLRLVERLQVLEGELASLRDREAKATEAITAASDGIQKKQADLERAKQKKAGLEQEIPIVERSIADLEKRLATTRAQEKELAAQFQAEQARFAEVDQKYQSQVQKNEQLTQLLVAAGEKHETQQRQVDQLERANAQLRVKLAGLQGDEEALAKAIAELEALEKQKEEAQKKKDDGAAPPEPEKKDDGEQPPAPKEGDGQG